jgi:hypothetical protein
MAPKRRGMQRARAINVEQPHVGTTRKERLDGFLKPETGGSRDGGLCHSIANIRVGALLEQQRSSSLIALVDGVDQIRRRRLA